ncbi:MAG: formate dehydrogenase subunit gamma [Candidatus Anammoxibacter sp.]
MNEKERITRNMSSNNTFYMRFELFHRFGHFLTIISFFGLALTGIPLVFKDQAWAAWLYEFMGGYPTAGIVHRFCAVLTFFVAFIHFIYLAYNIGVKKDKGFLWGPDSMIPQPKDLRDVLGDIKWFFGLGPRPQYGRWIYWEKIEYLSLMWGTLVMAVTGLILWHPVQAVKFVPGFLAPIIDLPSLALIVHRYEGILAICFIFIIHFIHTHLLPDKVPVNEAMFTGRVPEEELIHERGAQYELLKSENKLDELRVSPPSCMSGFLTRLIGIPLLILGLLISALMISGLLVLFI